MSWRPSKIGIGVLIAVGMSMGIVAAEPSYPIWVIPLISLLGATRAAVAVAVVR